MKNIILLLSVLLTGLVSAEEKSCQQELGKKDAAVLVAWCKNVSPAIRPPCNASNHCDLIISEIKRGCDFLKNEKDTPAYCRLTYGN